LPAPTNFPDLLDQGLIEDQPALQQYGFSIEGTSAEGFVRPRLQGFFGDKVVAIPADGDVTIYYLRRDLLENPAERAAFRRAHGRELAIPKTWQEYDQLVSFFHRPAQGLYGTAEERDPSGGWMFWLPRYFAQTAPHRKLLDENLKLLIDSRPVRGDRCHAHRTLLPPEILGEGKGLQPPRRCSWCACL
jgi:multiple sugar transport system substrate-binding protein